MEFPKSQGYVAASLCGSPCETYTEARFMPPPPEATHPEKWPRPLRSFLRLFGLDNLSHRKLRQLRAFFLQVVMVLSWHVARCGVVAEHPAPPTDRSRPSIWTFLAQISDHGRFGNDNGEHEHPNRRVCSR